MPAPAINKQTGTSLGFQCLRLCISIHCRRLRVQSLTRELRSHMLCSAAKKIKEQQQQNNKELTQSNKHPRETWGSPQVRFFPRPSLLSEKGAAWMASRAADGPPGGKKPPSPLSPLLTPMVSPFCLFLGPV